MRTGLARTAALGSTLALGSMAWGETAPRAAAGVAGPRPNIVLILADDLGAHDLGAYGNAFHETPHLDRLAGQGMRFTQAYAAAPNCSPSRASLLTGKSPARLRVTDFIAGRLYPRQRLSPPEWTRHLPLEEVTLAEALEPAGYASFMLGKWHLGGRSFSALEQGFDRSLGGSHMGYPPAYFSPYRIPNLPDGPSGQHLDERMAAEASTFIEEHRGRPFLLYLSFFSVHTPLQAEPEREAYYRRKLGPGPPGGNATYAAMVGSMDAAVGRVLATIDALGIAERTIVLFHSDNGGLLEENGVAVTSNAPLRAGKGHLYEGGIRVPLIVRWPGKVAPGSSCEEPVTGADLYPTLLEAVGAGGDARHNRALDGVSLLPLLASGGRRRPASRSLYWHYPHYNFQGFHPAGAIRRGPLKLIEHYEDGRLELYDLGTDAGEERDLAGSRPDAASELRRELDAWRRRVGAQMPVPNPRYDPKDPDADAHWGAQIP